MVWKQMAQDAKFVNKIVILTHTWHFAILHIYVLKGWRMASFIRHNVANE